VNLLPLQHPLRAGVIAMLAGAALTAGATDAPPAPPAAIVKLLACRAIAADTARLQCFDHTAAVLSGAVSTGRSVALSAQDGAMRGPALGAKAPPNTSSQPAAAFDPRLTFGLSSSVILSKEVATGVRQKSISSISERVAHLQAAADGRMVYRLSNGQVWAELMADGDAPPVKTGDRVTISRGWLGSYWMQTRSGRGCKVERLR
jgi:hypothetical protein